MAATFKNKFFSVKGQKERLTNVKNVLKIAVNPVSKQKIVANTKNKTVNKVLETVANHPYATAAAVTTLAKAPALLSSAKNKISGAALSNGISGTVAKAALSKGTGIGLNAAMIIGGGLLASQLLSNPSQTNPAQNNNAAQDLIQQPNQNSKQEPILMTDNKQFDFRRILNYALNSPGTSFSDAGQLLSSLPSQSLGASLGASQGASQQQDPSQSASTSGTSPWLLLGAGLLAYAALKE